MDQRRFDDWTKRFSAALNRRQLLRGVVSGAGAITVATVAEPRAGAQSACEPVGGLCELDDPCCDSLTCVGGTCHSAAICMGLGEVCEVSLDCCGDLLCLNDACGYELPQTGKAIIRAARSEGPNMTAIVAGTVALSAATMLRRKPAEQPPVPLVTVPTVPRMISRNAAVDHPKSVRYATARPGADMHSIRFTVDRYDAPPVWEFKQRVADLSDPVVPRKVVGYAFGDQALLFYRSKATPAPDAWLLVRDGRFLEQWYVVGGRYVSERLFALANAHYALRLGHFTKERLLQLSELPDGFAETCNTFRNPPILCETYELDGTARPETR